MDTKITESFLQQIAGDLEKLLIEDQSNIDWAFRRIGAGFKINLGCVLDSDKGGIVVNYALTFDLERKPEPIEKHKVTLRRVIDQNQASMEFLNLSVVEKI